jgi:hypothetical protein
MFSVNCFIILPDNDNVNPELVGEVEVILLCPPCVDMLGLIIIRIKTLK